MRLARKLTVALVLGIIAVMSGYAWLQTRQELVLFTADLRKNARVGRALRATVETVWQIYGEDRAMKLVEGADEDIREFMIRWVWLGESPDPARRPRLDPAGVETVRQGRIVRRDDMAAERRYTYIPLAIDGKPPAALELSESLEPQMTYIRTNRRAMILATVAVAAVCGLIALGLGYWLVGRPLRLLRDRARAVGAGDFSGRLSLRQRDEIGELASEIDAMCERLAEANRRAAAEAESRIDALEQLRHADRLATVGQLASGVAHELGTPLNVISARARLILGAEAAGEEATENARAIATQADRMIQIIRQLLDFSRRRGARLGPANIQQVVTRTLELLAPVAERHRVAIESVFDEMPAPIQVDQGQMQQALANVILNGIQSMPDGGRLTVRVGSRRTRPPDRDAAEQTFLTVSVEDGGSGIAPTHLSRIFEPFFTTKDVGEGTGLGLSVAYGIVAEHGGWIGVESEPERGSRFTIYLRPAGRAEAELDRAGT